MAKKKVARTATKTKKNPTDGPYLIAALLCESVLTEVDGLQSIIRITDAFTMTVHGDPASVPPGVAHATAFVIFKKGNASGTHELLFTVEKPDGKKAKLLTANVIFDPHAAPYMGVSFVTPMFIHITGPGTYWIELRLGGKLYTKMPLNVRFQQMSQMTPR